MKPHFRALALTVACLMFAACDVIPPPQGDLTRYFVLTEPAGSPVKAPAASALTVGLKPITLAGYLKRREIAVRSSANEISFNDFARWAEPVDASVARTVRASLLQQPAIAQVVVPPFPLDAKRDYDVTIEILRFEGSLSGPHGSASLEAMIQISVDGRVISTSRFLAPAATWDGKDYGQLAALLSADVDALGKEVASQLEAAAGSGSR